MAGVITLGILQHLHGGAVRRAVERGAAVQVPGAGQFQPADAHRRVGHPPGLEALGTDELDIVILENVGNLVCPAEFDTGAAKNAMILSVPEGDDKPLKYPLMFSVCHALLVNKIDTLPVFDFDLAAVEQRAKQRNPQLEMFPVSARTGEGMEAWVGWLDRQIRAWKEQ